VLQISAAPVAGGIVAWESARLAFRRYAKSLPGPRILQSIVNESRPFFYETEIKILFASRFVRWGGREGCSIFSMLQKILAGHGVVAANLTYQTKNCVALASLGVLQRNGEPLGFQKSEALVASLLAAPVNGAFCYKRCD
jgi:hypothetical protein